MPPQAEGADFFPAAPVHRSGEGVLSTLDSTTSADLGPVQYSEDDLCFWSAVSSELDSNTSSPPYPPSPRPSSASTAASNYQTPPLTPMDPDDSKPSMGGTPWNHASRVLHARDLRRGTAASDYETSSAQIDSHTHEAVPNLNAYPDTRRILLEANSHLEQPFVHTEPNRPGAPAIQQGYQSSPGSASLAWTAEAMPRGEPGPSNAPPSHLSLNLSHQRNQAEPPADPYVDAVPNDVLHELASTRMDQGFLSLQLPSPLTQMSSTFASLGEPIQASARLEPTHPVLRSSVSGCAAPEVAPPLGVTNEEIGAAYPQPPSAWDVNPTGSGNNAWTDSSSLADAAPQNILSSLNGALPSNGTPAGPEETVNPPFAVYPKPKVPATTLTPAYESHGSGMYSAREETVGISLSASMASESRRKRAPSDLQRGIGLAAPNLHSVARRPLAKQRRRYNQPRSSKYCHLCARHERVVEMLPCGNLQQGLCQKSVCHKCFVTYNLDWDAAVASAEHLAAVASRRTSQVGISGSQLAAQPAACGGGAGSDRDGNVSRSEHSASTGYGSGGQAQGPPDDAVPKWLCPHCTNSCPKRAKCFAYDRQTVRRRVKTQEARMLSAQSNNSTK